MEKSLVLVKPDAIQRGLAGTILSRFERRGLKIIAMKMIQIDKSLARKHYEAHKDKSFFNELVDFITSSPVIAVVFEGKRAVDIIRQTMGSTDAAKAAPGTIRGDFGMDLQLNLVHGSDSIENAHREISIFFNSEEVISYQRAVEKWTTGS